MKEILEYLKALEQNNNREWYHNHKKDYQAANEAFLNLVQDMMLEMGRYEPGILHINPKDLTYRLVRDTRFSADKSPYNPSFRAHISASGKLPVPVGHYIAIKPGNRTVLGGGLFADMFKDATKMIRDAIVLHGNEWEAIITDRS